VYSQVQATPNVFAASVVVPMRAVGDVLGDVESWPTNAIYNMFVTEHNTISVKKVAAFMYGNGVPIEKAVDCFMCRIGQLLCIICYERLVLYMR